MRLHRRPGFSLIEMLVTILALSMLTMVVAALLYGALGIQQADTAAHARLAAQSSLADRFREDVANAVGAPDELDDHKASPRCLILKRADDSHVVYQWDGEQVERRDIDDFDESRQRLPLRAEKAEATFIRAGDLVTLRIRETRGRGGASRERVLDISAALGGDRR